MRPYLLADPKGAEFLKQYYFISTLYNTKDIVKTFVERGYDVLVDYEFLLSAWSTYQDTNSYLNIDQQNANFIRIKNELKIIQETYLFYVEHSYILYDDDIGKFLILNFDKL